MTSPTLERSAEALFERGAALQGLGRLEEALEAYGEAIAASPRFAAAFRHRAATLQAMGRDRQALDDYDRAITLRPDDAEARYGRATAIHRLGGLQEALAHYDRTLALRPQYPEALCDRTVALSQLQRWPEALESCERAIELRPDYAEAHINRGNVLHASGRHEEALASFDRTLALDPTLAEAHGNRGGSLLALGRHGEALAALDEAIRLEPGRVDAYRNRAIVRYALNQTDAAIADYDAAIALRPDDAEARHGRGMAQLRLGRFDEGWRDYEWRLKTRAAAALEGAFDDAQRWRGEALAGRLFVHFEQGLGDTLQFFRYIPMLEARGLEVAFAAQPPLKTLLARASTAKMLGEDDPAQRFERHCPLLSLPLALGSTLETIPSPAPYLSADAARVARFAARVGPRSKLRVGLAWSGNPAHRDDRNRSIAFAELRRLLIDDADWIAIQNEVRPADMTAFRDCGCVRFFGEEIADFSDTAALVELVDLVISVDTSVAHLAGAMGKPVWILLPFSPDWRWMLNRRDTPWYPSARLYRQSAIGVWGDVLDEVRRDLAARSR